jgi:hypothetical protein
MDLQIPLKRFNEQVADAEKADLELPHLKQKRWLLESFAFGDDVASYEPVSLPWRISRRNAWAPWWWKMGRKPKWKLTS